MCYLDTVPHPFDSAAMDSIRMLQARCPSEAWFVARMGDSVRILAVSENRLGLSPGTPPDWLLQLGGSAIERSTHERRATVAEVINERADCPLLSATILGCPISSRDVPSGILCGLWIDSSRTAAAEAIGIAEYAASMMSRLLECENLAVDLHRETLRRTCEAEMDALTELYNRRGWDELFAAEGKRIRHVSTRAAVISLDLDDLKRTNDALGHSAGDELLRRAANAIRFSTRLTDVAARVGGDEFAILLCECGASEAKKALRRLESNLDLMEVRASVGLGILEDHEPLQEAYDRADRQMRAHKIARKKVERAVCLLESDPAGVHESP